MNKIFADEFPELLLQIPDPPKHLYIEGTLPKNELKYLTIVGSRKYTAYGKEVCEMLISSLRGYAVAIVSGLALGIDSIAHRSALEAELVTIAVPGSGLGREALYPSIHANLAKKILESGGALISEFEPDFKATPWSFPQRNRIMAGLSHATLVIEAEAKSGTLITAKLATEYNRDVLAVPGGIFSANSEGPHLLIRLGATPVTKSDDLLEALHIKKIGKTFIPPADCSPEELKVIELIRNPISREDLILSLNIPISEVNSLLSIMELKGIIVETMGEIHLK